MYGKLIMSITYGIDVESAGDPYITNARKALFAITAAGNVGTYLVDSIPWCKHSLVSFSEGRMIELRQ